MKMRFGKAYFRGTSRTINRDSVSDDSRRRKCRRTSQRRSGRRDKSNPLFSAWQPARTMVPSRHSGNKTSSNHDPSPPCKPPLVCARARTLGSIYESLYKCNETVTGGVSSITPLRPPHVPFRRRRRSFPPRSSSPRRTYVYALHRHP